MTLEQILKQMDLDQELAFSDGSVYLPLELLHELRDDYDTLSMPAILDEDGLYWVLGPGQGCTRYCSFWRPSELDMVDAECDYRYDLS